MNSNIIDHICLAISRKNPVYLPRVDDVHQKIHSLFKLLSISKQANEKIITTCTIKFNTPIKQILPQILPNHIPRVRGPASYYMTNDMYVIITSGQSYLILYKKIE